MPTEIKAKEKTKKLSQPHSERWQFIVKLAEKVRSDDTSREVWKNKTIVAKNSRLGLKRRTNRPYPGATEVPVPLTDKLIVKVKNVFMSVATKPKKQIICPVQEGIPVTQEMKDSARNIERALNGLIRKRDFKWAKKVALFCDYFLENGHAIFKITEKFFSRTAKVTFDMNELGDEDRQIIALSDNSQLSLLIANRYSLDIDDTEDQKSIGEAIEQIRSGKEVIEINRKAAFSEPTVEPAQGIRVIVSPGTNELQRAIRITHEMWLSHQELMQRARKGIYNMDAVKKLDPEGGMDDQSLFATAQNTAEGISTKMQAQEFYRIRECYTWYQDQKWVFTWVEDVGSGRKGQKPHRDPIILKEMKFPYEHGMWPFVKHDAEVTSTRWYASRGIPERIRGLQQIADKMLNARIIRDEMNNAPMFRVSKALGYSGDEIRFRPGQMIEGEAGQIEQLNKAVTVDVSSERLEQQMKAYSEEYIGVPDFTLRNATNQGSQRTKGEIEIAQANFNALLSNDVSLFLETLSEVANHMYLLLKETIVQPTLIGGVVLTPQDMQVPVNPVWVGSLEAADLSLQEQKSLRRLQIMSQLGLNTGVVTQEDFYNAFRNWLETDPDVEDADLFSTRPQVQALDEVERQQNEILRMKNGFQVTVRPDDQHGTHLQVMEQYLNSLIGQQEMQRDPQFRVLFESHMNIHLQAEQMTQQNVNPRIKRRMIQIAKAQENGRAVQGAA